MARFQAFLDGANRWEMELALHYEPQTRRGWVIRPRRAGESWLAEAS